MQVPPSCRRSLLARCARWPGAVADRLRRAAAADTGGTQVAAAFYPLQYVAQRVAGDHAEVENLTQPGAEPHDLELDDPRDRRGRARPTSWSTRAASSPRSTTASSPERHRRRCLDAADRGRPRADEDRRPTGTDPHFWQDPLRMADARRRGGAPSSRTSTPRTRGDVRRQRRAPAPRADRARRGVRRGLARLRRDTSWSRHDAFGYLGRYGLRIEPIAGLSPDAEPTPADLGRLQELIRDRRASPRSSPSAWSAPGDRAALAARPGIALGRAGPDRGPQRPDRRRGLPLADAARTWRRSRRPTDVDDPHSRPPPPDAPVRLRGGAVASAAARSCATST